MGSIIKALCSCGFETEFFGGSLRSDQQSVCMAPALCAGCGNLQTVNYLEKDCHCPVCRATVVFYNDPALQAEQVSSGPQPEDFVLPRSACLCPSCGCFSLHFEPLSCCE
ncbi:MAG: hypothetical protein JW832_01425 [Deltaproteobacteria bacterium]|nr:hypothetical protein [Deltaproteobacteria bacterium]